MNHDAVTTYENLEQLRGKRVVLLGLGREGESTYRFLKQQSLGCSFVAADASVTANSSGDAPGSSRLPAAEVELVLGPQYLQSLRTAEVIVKTAGIRPDLPELTAARQRGVPVLSNTSLFFSCVSCPVIGVTGTKGKSTTTATIAHVLHSLGQTTHLLGNIGIPPLDGLPAIGSGDLAVVELSSFQLTELHQSPSIAVLQNIAPEHLDYHHTFEEYRAAKARITRFQTAEDLLVFNHDSATARHVALTSPARLLSFGLTPPSGDGCWSDEEAVYWRQNGHETELCSRSDVPLLGEFNLLNVLPSLTIAMSRGLNKALIPEAVRSMKSLEHRLEPCGTIAGRRFFNDSLATVPDATVAALGALGAARIVLIAGGYDRGIDFGPLSPAFKHANLGGLVLFRPTGEKIAEVFERSAAGPSRPPLCYVESMAEAVERAFEISQPQDVILMSPGSASFGLFQDYRDRGEQFKKGVQSLRERYAHS